MKGRRNFWGARLAAVAFWFATCGGQITGVDHKKATRKRRGDEAPKHCLGDTSIRLLTSCFYQPMGVDRKAYPLQVVSET
jgi:hypothetical protein